MELDGDQRQALALIENGYSVFVGGTITREHSKMPCHAWPGPVTGNGCFGHKLKGQVTRWPVRRNRQLVR